MDQNKNWINWRYFNPTTISELIPIMTSNAQDGFVITTSAVISTYYGYYVTQDGTQSTAMWATGANPGWWQINFPYDVYVSYITIKSPIGSGMSENWSNASCPIKFSGSNNGSTWTTLYEGTLGTTNLATRITLPVNSENISAYSMYRITFNGYSSSGRSAIYNTQFYGYQL